MPNPGPPWEPPSEFDGFSMTRLLGAGSMGRVYLARDKSLDRDVAIKLIASERPEVRAVERFLVEAKAIARIQHPNVVSVYRIGEVEGRPYIAYELIHGTSLEAVDKPMPWPEVLRIALGLARGLAAANMRGVLHRDIKPANVMLSDDGVVKLVDFGIAKVAGYQAAPSSPGGGAERLDPFDLDATQTDLFSTRPVDAPPRDRDSGLTEVGVVIGTLRYIAPERLNGEPATARSEVFSLGLVVYELCTGTTGERGRGIGESSLHLLQRPLAPVKRLAPEIPTELAEVVDRAVRIDPEARWQSPEEVRDAFEHAAARLSGPREPFGAGARRGGTVALERLLLVEDDDDIRTEVSVFLESPPCGISVTACADVRSALAAIDGPRPFDVALVDLGLPDGSGIDVIRRLREKRPDCPVVVFTIYGDPDTIFEALRAGACGYLLKQTPPERLFAALLDAAAGGAPMSPTIARRVVTSFSRPEADGPALTEREREVLGLLSRGLSYADVAKGLAIGLGTVETHVKAIYTKLEVRSKAEAAAVAARLGLVR